MHARWLVEIATLLVLQARQRPALSTPVPPAVVHRYWSVSRQRFERWQGQLADHRDRLLVAGACHRLAAWKAIRPVFEEVFLSDILTRALAAYGKQLEGSGEAQELAPIAHNVFLSPEDVRHRCLRLLMTPGLPVDQAVALNRMRYALEKWSDTFLAQFFVDSEKIQYVFAVDRTAQLIAEANDRPSETSQLVAWQLMLASCQRWMNQHCKATSANPDLNQLVGESVLAIIHPDRVPLLSPFPTSFGQRVTTLIDQANLWIEQLLKPAGYPHPQASR
jgi:hypothetical protein